MKLLIIGEGRHGKDYAADFLSKELKIKNAGATSVLLVEELANLLGMDFQYLYENRHKYREILYAYGKKIRKDKGLLYLVKGTLEKGDIVVGVRDECEATINCGLFDYVVWIDASIRIKEKDPTMDYNYHDVVRWTKGQLFTIYNNTTLQEFDSKLRGLAQLLGSFK